MHKRSYQVFIIALIAALGGFLFGFDTAVIAGTTSDLERIFSLDKSGLGFTVATALIGTIVGTLIVGKPADLYGRKRVLILTAVLYTCLLYTSDAADEEDSVDLGGG